MMARISTASSSTAAASTRTTSVEGPERARPGSRRPARRRSSRTRAAGGRSTSPPGARAAGRRPRSGGRAAAVPMPMIVGATTSRSASTRPAASSAAPSRALPWTCSSRPGRDLSAPTVRTGSPRSTVVGCHVPSVSVFVTTYLGSAFIRSVNGSSGSVICGQSRANAS